MAFKVKLPIIQLGGVYDPSFNYWHQDASGVKTPVDLTGYEVVMGIFHAGVEIDTISTLNGRIQVSGNNIQFNVTADITVGWSFQEADYDMLIYPTGSPHLAKLALYGKLPAYKVKTQLP